jgi:hypothetical protein
LPDPQKFTQLGNFGLKLCHLATLQSGIENYGCVSATNGELSGTKCGENFRELNAASERFIELKVVLCQLKLFSLVFDF